METSQEKLRIRLSSYWLMVADMVDKKTINEPKKRTKKYTPILIREYATGYKACPEWLKPTIESVRKKISIELKKKNLFT